MTSPCVGFACGFATHPQPRKPVQGFHILWQDAKVPFCNVASVRTGGVYAHCHPASLTSASSLTRRLHPAHA